MKRILLTGGLGYIGQKFQEKFQDKYFFSVLDTGYFKTNNLNNIENTSNNEKVSLIFFIMS